jgi:hypothetical protein
MPVKAPKKKLREKKKKIKATEKLPEKKETPADKQWRAT